MSEHERDSTPRDAAGRQGGRELSVPDPAGDPPSIAVALQSPAKEALDRQLGRGIVFNLGENQGTRLELFPSVIRLSLPFAQLAIPRTEATVRSEGVVFEDAGFFLSVGASGGVLFQASPARQFEAPHQKSSAQATEHPPAPADEPRSPAPEEKEPKPKSERYVGRLGEVQLHRTKAGKLVAEVELTVADPQHPGSSQLVKFVAFGEMAETLQKNYQPGQLVTAVGIPHELKRQSRDGREWTERQLYFVQPPKPREKRSDDGR